MTHGWRLPPIRPGGAVRGRRVEPGIWRHGVDRAYAVCYALAGAVLNNNTPARWEAAMIALGVACRKNADIPASAARTLCDRRNRPEGLTKLPEECRPFYELMVMAKLVPRD